MMWPPYVLDIERWGWMACDGRQLRIAMYPEPVNIYVYSSFATPADRIGSARPFPPLGPAWPRGAR
jgi:hypothetical protein